MNELRLIHDADRGRYRLMQGAEEIGYIDYDAVGVDTIRVRYTEVLPQYRSQGFGAELMRRALDDIRAQRKRVVPVCSYALSYIQNHPEYHPLLREDLRGML